MSIVLYIVKNQYAEIKYVGITSKKLEYRIKDHEYSSKKGSQCLIHKALRKNKLFFEEFLVAQNWEIACELEVKFIKQFKTHVTEGGYNLTLGGEGNVGHIKSPELRKQISKRMIGKRYRLGSVVSDETKMKIRMKNLGKSNPVRSVKIEDNFGNTYNSITEASKKTGIKRTTINAALKFNRIVNNSFRFAYLEKR